jgi:hypothetical protein
LVLFYGFSLLTKLLNSFDSSIKQADEVSTINTCGNYLTLSTTATGVEYLCPADVPVNAFSFF